MLQGIHHFTKAKVDEGEHFKVELEKFMSELVYVVLGSGESSDVSVLVALVTNEESHLFTSCGAGSEVRFAEINHSTDTTVHMEK